MEHNKSSEVEYSTSCSFDSENSFTDVPLTTTEWDSSTNSSGKNNKGQNASLKKDVGSVGWLGNILLATCCFFLKTENHKIIQSNPKYKAVVPLICRGDKASCQKINPGLKICSSYGSI